MFLQCSLKLAQLRKTWPNEEAAELLARIIADGMALGGENNIGLWDEKANSGDLVLVTLGGGYYAPRANKLASMDLAGSYVSNLCSSI